MRTAFHSQLDALLHTMADMCELGGTAMERATRALLDVDIVLAETVISDHRDFVTLGVKAENDAFNLLALQSPVATDLRAVLGCMQNVGDVFRMGVLARHVADIVRRRHPEPAIPADVNDYFAEMGRIAVNLGHNAKDVVLSGNPDRAAQLACDDDAMDELHRLLFSIVLDQKWSHTVGVAVDVTLLSRYYERFADHAVTVGQRVIFQAMGAPTG
ncbi:Phosphate uptake regulator [Mycobacterium rhizamassiliense]|jgi:phosphate transport system protein|uniref:Phosphate uptake regulator n=1 Tax=Mycobacterium rhizamassiliense TaxID=1841860 RepID=A0A2U3P1X0_9MYCO|nr:phosphate signaling complex protein PhoU [Mycobacterium rhizamassiliense]SPM37744.1 Phosphate uptake regulator [Mycobacterium rhizamassiliense]